ncbi:Mth938-like domain-containing protein [Alkalilacustris brevis]|uniref:Mth938-like domain-containing protein n=1 Tax=Alkalilacustris brevis TaxID=2026338 RepID=UPI000E0DEF67|nr:Mth938-like domain-containing protein [Alkalilacustris brevis]
MQINEVSFGQSMVIDGYGPGFFRIAGERHDGAVLVQPGSLRSWGGLEDRAPLLDLRDEIDVLLVGTGAEIAPLPATLRAELEEAGIGVEMMATPPACRTYNVLLSEGRRIAAALLPVG